MAILSRVSLSKFLKISGLSPSGPGTLLLLNDLKAAAVNVLFLLNLNCVGLVSSVFSVLFVFRGCVQLFLFSVSGH